MHDFSITFLWIAIILVAAKISSLLERVGQPLVLGELLIGIVLGNMVLVGIDVFEPIKADQIIEFLAEFGVVVLLFQIGLESNLKDFAKVGKNALLVAVAGVVAPFLLGTFVVGPLVLPQLCFINHMFIGATLTATSVGITARVFKDLKRLHSQESQVVLGAAVIDDILGLIILASVTAIAITGNVSLADVGFITFKSVAFLFGVIVLGGFLAPKISRLFSLISNRVGMEFTLAISFCLTFAYLASMIGLAPIIGAFAGGLILQPSHFKYFKEFRLIRELRRMAKANKSENNKKLLEVVNNNSKHQIEDLISPIGFFFVPIFFVYTGMNVDIETLFHPPVLLVGLGITIAAIVGKVIAGLFAGKANKLIVGFGMVPRGEVGLIFASVGKEINLVNDEVYSIIVIMVILTTLISPPILSSLIKKFQPEDSNHQNRN